MTNEKAEKIIDVLSHTYPEAECELDFETPFQLLVATILSAQCTDKRVNIVTKELFKKASAPKDFANMPETELEKKIYSCGFYKNKAKNIINASRAIIVQHNGQVPNDFDALIDLPGVGRKTANVVMANAFGGDNIAVDTHVFRVSRRLGLSDGKTPFDVEKDLEKLLPDGKKAASHHFLIFHGRYTCKSQKPNCADCTVKEYCREFNS